MAPLADTDLFTLDSTGSEAVRTRLQGKEGKRGSGLSKASEILTSRSSYPAIVAPKHARQRERDAVGLSTSDVRRLKSLVKRKQKASQGLNGLPDRRPMQGSSAAFEQAPEQFDIWSAAEPSQSQTLAVKAPATLRKHELLSQAAPPSIALPLPGQSYNPTHEAHQQLLDDALVRVSADEAAAVKATAIKKQYDQIRIARQGKELWELAEDDAALQQAEAEVEAEAEASESIRKKQSRPKTEKERKRRAHNINEQKKAEAAKLIKKTQNVQLHNIPNLIKQLEAQTTLSTRQKQASLLALRQRVKQQGMPTSSRRSHRHLADAGGQLEAYQLEEDLSESLRGLKAEGNLWQDWQTSQVKRRKMPIVAAEQSFKKTGKTKTKERVDFRLWEARHGEEDE